MFKIQKKIPLIAKRLKAIKGQNIPTEQNAETLLLKALGIMYVQATLSELQIRVY